MAVVWGPAHPIEELDGFDDGAEAARRSRCFYCYKPMTFPCIEWRGEKLIHLHTDCLGPLVTRLTLDAYDIELSEEGHVSPRIRKMGR